MYDTHMRPADVQDHPSTAPSLPAGQFDRLDRALLDLRRFWAAPDAVPDAALGAPARPVEMSTLLVVDAVRAGAGAGEVTVGGVAHHLDVAPSTASRLVDRAVRAGVVAKVPGGPDRRRAGLVLTPGGVQLEARARAFRERRLAALLEGWSAQDTATLAELLGRLAAAVRAEDDACGG